MNFWKGHNAVYRIYDADDQLLYIGFSQNWPRRLRQHRHASGSQSWFDRADHYAVRIYRTKAEALAAERVAIVTERPRHNSPSTAVVAINGHFLRAMRTLREIGPRELAEAIGKNRSRIAQIEAMGDAHNRVSVGVLHALAGALDLDDPRALLVDPYGMGAAA